MYNKLPFSFRNVKYATFEDDKIIINKCYSRLFHYTSSNVYFFFIIYLWVLVFFIFGAIIDSKFQITNSEIVFAFFILLIGIFFTSLYQIAKIQVVIDFKKNCIYSESIILGLIYIKFGKVYKEDVSQIGNNVYTRIVGRNDSSMMHPDTKYIHKYSVDLLLKNGKLLNQFILGSEIEDYGRSVEIVRAISYHWKLPVITCKDNCQLEVVKSSNEYDNNYKLAVKKIEPDSVVKGLLRFFKVMIIIVALLMIIIVALYLLLYFIAYIFHL